MNNRSPYTNRAADGSSRQAYGSPQQPYGASRNNFGMEYDSEVYYDEQYGYNYPESGNGPTGSEYYYQPQNRQTENSRYPDYEEQEPAPAHDNERVPLVLYLILAFAVLMSVLTLNSFSVSDKRSDASMGLMDSFHQRAEKISNMAFGDLLGYKMSFFIPETTVVCPKPDAGAFGSSADDAVIDAVISGSDLARGAQLVWHDGIQYHPDTVPVYYSDQSIFSLAWKENNGLNIINFCEIIIADGSQFRRLLCDNTFGSNNEKYATTMAESVNAVVAMNGDFYAHRQAGVVVYQGKVYRNNPQFLDQCFIDQNGDMIFKRKGEIGTDEEFQKFVDDNGIRFSLSFGPILVENHKAIQSIKGYSLGEVDETFARTSMGMVGEKHYLFCLVEGGKGSFRGIDILGMADIMEKHGCEKAYTLDGGQTAELIFNNKLYNRVVYEAERQVSDIIFFATASGN